MAKLDHLYSKEYDYEKYNCYDFTRDAWLVLTGEDIGGRDCGLLGLFRRIQRENRRSAKEPSSLCIFVARQEKSTPHIGIIWNGNAIHFREHGARSEPLEDLRQEFKDLVFYK